MLLYIVKSIGCLGCLLAVYRVFFYQEKLWTFNRYMLLLSVLLAISLPIINITPLYQLFKETTNINTITHHTKTSSNDVSFFYYLEQINNKPIQLVNSKINAIKTFQFFDYCFYGYCLLTSLLFIRFIFQLLQIRKIITHGKHLSYKSATLVLSSRKIDHCAFGKYIIVERAAYEKVGIHEDILEHEFAHVNFQHSIDILIIEFIKVFFWYNPLIRLAQKYLELTHELQADDHVLQHSSNQYAYQQLILQASSQSDAISLTKNFSYSIIKKRLQMTQHVHNSKTVWLKKISAFPFFLFCMFMFTKQSTQAQVADASTTKTIESKPERQVQKDTLKTKMNPFPTIGYTKEGTSLAQLAQYRQIVFRHTINGRFTTAFFNALSNEEKDSLITIFKQMSLAQQDTQNLVFVKRFGPGKAEPPTAKQFENIKNPTLYGIWIDDKKVDNNVLNQYKATDFADMNASKLYGAAKRNKSYSVQVNLLTKEAYKSYYKKALEEKDKPLMVLKDLKKPLIVVN